MLGHSGIEYKVCQKADVKRTTRLKTVYQRISCLYVDFKATGWRVFVMRERATKELDKNAASVY